MTSDPYGTHRVIEPAGALPQAAEKLDADPAKRFADEIHIEVETLNVDSASMRQIETSEGNDAARVGRRIAEIVATRGKMQNPVTGSGGMLLGRVAWIGEAAAPRAAEWGARVGDRVATLVSLTLTPLWLERIERVRLDTHQVDVRGNAVVFTSGCLARLPDDLPERLALGALDVAGAAPQMARLLGEGDSALILGAGGKSGLLCAAAARRRVGAGGLVVGLESHPKAAEAAARLEHCDAVVQADATDPVGVLRAASAAGGERIERAGGFDLVVSCVNVAGAELAAILCARQRGRVYFFSMATSFARAALGAEGVSKDVDLFIGNGYCMGHAAATLDLLRQEPQLREELARRFA
jgi:L-erythro-3,5-diaminohexanoate dehydrogenase